MCSIKGYVWHATDRRFSFSHRAWLYEGVSTDTNGFFMLRQRTHQTTAPPDDVQLEKEPQIKVIYIMGAGHSGSTLLDISLGESPGLFSCDELHTIFESPTRHICGCGSALTECAVWRQVLDLVFPSSDLGSQLRKIADYQRVVRARDVFPMLYGRPAHLPSSITDYGEVIVALYRAIARVTGASVIVDSSKEASYAALIGLLPGIDAHLIHLVRDPRAVVYSYLRAKSRRQQHLRRWEMRRSLAAYSRRWVLANVLCEIVRKRLPAPISQRIRYEEFVTDPQSVLANTNGAFSPGSPTRDIVEGDSLHLGPNHTVTGNASRNRTGRIPLRLDDAWMGTLGTGEQATISGITLPLMVRYQYPLRPQHT